MKKHKNLLTLLAVFVVLVGAYFVMNQINKNQADNEVEDTVMVTDVSNVVSIEYTDGETTMSFVKEDSVWHSTENRELELDADSVESMVAELGQVEAVRKLEGADEPSVYGLEEPSYTVTLKDVNDKQITLYIGDSAEGNYYATVDDKTVIYTISSGVVDALEFDISAFEVKEETSDTTEVTDEETTE